MLSEQRYIIFRFETEQNKKTYVSNLRLMFAVSI